MLDNDPFITKLKGCGMYGTYRMDVPLFTKLGLLPFKDLEHGKRTEIGVLVFPVGKIAISVTCFPAQFWRFVLHRKDPEAVIVLTTGSGNMTRYWPTVMMFLEDMMNAKVRANVQ